MSDNRTPTGILADWQAMAFDRGMTEHVKHFLYIEDLLHGRGIPATSKSEAIHFLTHKVKPSPEKDRIMEALRARDSLPQAAK